MCVTGFPAEPVMGTLAVKPLLRYLVPCLVEYLRFQVCSAGGCKDVLYQFNYRIGFFDAKVEGFADDPLVGKSLGNIEVGLNGIPNIKVFAQMAAVTADDRALTPECRDNGAGYQAIEVEVTAAIQVAATGHRKRHPVSVVITERNQVSAGF